MKKLIASLAFASLVIAPTKADINATLDKIVSSSYYQAPGEIKSPTTNTYTLGSYSFRLRNDLLNRPVLSLRPPKATFSCSGADFVAIPSINRVSTTQSRKHSQIVLIPSQYPQ